MISRHPRAAIGLSIAAATAALIGLTGCSTASSSDATSSVSASSMPQPKYDKSLRAAFPASIRKSGELNLATISFPPYSYKDTDGSTDIGINWDTVEAIESATHLKVNLTVVPGITDIYTGFDSGKYDASISPLSDTATTQEQFDFATWINEYVVFLQQKTASKKVTSLESACGNTIATLKGGAAETVLKDAQANCGSNPIKIALFSDQDSAVLAVKSGRADAAFSSQIPLTYYTQKDSSLKISGANSTENGFPPFAVGAYAPKGSDVIDPILGVMKELKTAGTYDAILRKYGIEDNAAESFGKNTAAAS